MSVDAGWPDPLYRLYSFRRCPYAIRARLALAYCHIQCELREVKLSDKPDEMLAISPKGTVPVLHILEDNRVIDQSIDIMKWALKLTPEQQWYSENTNEQRIINELIYINDHEFKPWLDKYKYADRYPENSKKYYFDKACNALKSLIRYVAQKNHLDSAHYNLADIATLPFIRQFASVDRKLFKTALPILEPWLDEFLNDSLFKNVMHKYTPWQPHIKAVYFP